MLLKRQIFILLMHILLLPAVYANSIDSLQHLLKHAPEKEKTEILLQLSKSNWVVSPGKGVYYGKEAILQAEKYHNRSQQAKALLYIGVNYWFMGSYDEAIRYYQQSLKISFEIKDDKLCAYNLNNLGMVHTNLKNYEQAIDFYKRSLLLMGKMGDSIESAKIRNNIAGLNFLSGRNELALEQHLSVLKIIEKSKDKTFLIWLYNDIGEVYTKLNQLNDARQYFQKALNLSTQTNNPLGKSLTLTHLGEINLMIKAYNTSKSNFFEALEYARSSNSKEQVNEIYRNISEFYATINDYKSSLRYYKLYKQMSDSIINESKIRNIIEMQSRYDMESKENENKVLQKNIEIQDLTIRKNNIQQTLLILLLLFTSILILLIYSKSTVRKRKNKELEEKNLQINQQKDQLTKIFSIIAHDLKSPVNIILGYADILKNDYEDFSSEQKKQFISYIHRGILDCYDLLNNLLQWSGAQQGRIGYKPENIKLTQLVSETTKVLNQWAIEKNIRIQNLIEEDLVITGDYNMLAAIIRNLISNAIKFTHEGGKITIEAIQQSDNQMIEVAVKDNGCGISEENQQKLFKLSSHLSTKGTAKESGTGLGLLLCKEFVEKHNGTIYLKSEKGKGSVFYFTIPQANTEQN